jgi:4-hydroxybenzoate polyprenyltransferase
VISIFKLLRLTNLVIIALTLYAFRYLVVLSYYGMSGTKFQMDNFSFGLMVMTTLFIAAAGYLVNDYFDLDIDRVNCPDKFSVNGTTSGRSLIINSVLFSSLSVIGIILLTIRLQSVIMTFVLLIALMAVWWYARILKRSYIWGNLAVSLMSAFTLGMAWFFEWILLNKAGIDLFETRAITEISIGICFFAFMLSLIREIVKDIEDMEGDSQFGCRSIPIIKGIPVTKKVVAILTFMLFLALLFSQYWLLRQNFQLVLIWLVPSVELPILLFLFRLRKANTVIEYHRLSLLLKWIMVGGIASMGIIWLNFRF